MLKTKYISNCTEKDVDELKSAILFFDNVDIVDNVLYKVEDDKSQKNSKKGYKTGTIVGVNNFVTEKYLTHIESLVTAGIVNITNDENKSKDKVWNKIDEVVSSIFQSDFSILFDEKDIVKNKQGKKISSTVSLTDETKLIHEEFVGRLEIGSTLDLDFIVKYYSSLLSSLFLHISKGEQCITASTSLNKFLQQYSKNQFFERTYKSIQSEGVNPNLAINAIKLAAPNISSFPFDEVLETREKAKSELQKFRHELETVQFNLLENYTMAEIQTKSAEIVKHKINPSLQDLKRKIEGIDLKLPRDVINEFKDPKSYTPLLGTIFGSMPIYLSALISLGLISASVAYDYILSRKDIKAHGLYYLIELNNKFGKK